MHFSLAYTHAHYYAPTHFAVIIEEPMSDEVISESLGPSDARRWRDTLAADQAQQDQQPEPSSSPQFSTAYAAMLG